LMRSAGDTMEEASRIEGFISPLLRKPTQVVGVREALDEFELHKELCSLRALLLPAHEPPPTKVKSRFEN
jgi:hypothetical protein